MPRLIEPGGGTSAYCFPRQRAVLQVSMRESSRHERSACAANRGHSSQLNRSLATLGIVLGHQVANVLQHGLHVRLFKLGPLAICCAASEVGDCCDYLLLAFLVNAL